MLVQGGVLSATRRVLQSNRQAHSCPRAACPNLASLVQSSERELGSVNAHFTSQGRTPNDGLCTRPPTESESEETFRWPWPQVQLAENAAVPTVRDAMMTPQQPTRPQSARKTAFPCTATSSPLFRACSPRTYASSTKILSDKTSPVTAAVDGPRRLPKDSCSSSGRSPISVYGHYYRPGAHGRI